MLRKFLHVAFPYLNHYEVTQTYVWRQALHLQRKQADEDRGGLLGHYYEFGVFRLRSIINFNKVRNWVGRGDGRFKDMEIFAIDSFEGLPALDANDTYDPHFVEGSYCCNLDEVKGIAKRNKIKNIHYIKGFYEDTLTDDLAIQMASKPPCLVHIDCDTFSSTITVLRWLDKIALPGAIYFFDDLWRYHGHPEAGELGAINTYNADTAKRGMLTEHPLSLGSKKVYAFCPRDPEYSVNYHAVSQLQKEVTV